MAWCLHCPSGVLLHAPLRLLREPHITVSLVWNYVPLVAHHSKSPYNPANATANGYGTPCLLASHTFMTQSRVAWATLAVRAVCEYRMLVRSVLAVIVMLRCVVCMSASPVQRCLSDRCWRHQAPAAVPAGRYALHVPIIALRFFPRAWSLRATGT